MWTARKEKSCVRPKSKTGTKTPRSCSFLTRLPHFPAATTFVADLAGALSWALLNFRSPQSAKLKVAHLISPLERDRQMVRSITCQVLPFLFQTLPVGSLPRGHTRWLRQKSQVKWMSVSWWFNKATELVSLDCRNRTSEYRVRWLETARKYG